MPLAPETSLRPATQTGKIKSIAAFVVIAGSVAFLILSLRATPPPVDPRPHEALGQILAEEAAKALSSGGRLTVITRDPLSARIPAAEFQVKSFYRALQKLHVTPAATNLVQLDPLRLVRVPPGEFVDLMRRQSEADVIVSFLGPPVLTAQQTARLGDKRPRIPAVCSGATPQQVNLRDVFDQNFVQAAIISREQPGPAPSPTSSPRECFDSLYKLITRANLSELPAITNNVSL